MERGWGLQLVKTRLPHGPALLLAAVRALHVNRERPHFHTKGKFPPSRLFLPLFKLRGLAVWVDEN